MRLSGVARGLLPVVLAGLMTAMVVHSRAADGSVADVVKARQTNFKAIGAATKTIADELKEKSPDKAVLLAAAQKIEGLSKDLGNWFPAGSGAESGLKTEALPAIWADPDGFAKARSAFATQAALLAQTAAGGDLKLFAGTFKALGDTCGGCHKGYRQPHD